MAIRYDSGTLFYQNLRLDKDVDEKFGERETCVHIRYLKMYHIQMIDERERQCFEHSLCLDNSCSVQCPECY